MTPLPRPQSPRLALRTLEDRVTPASAVYSGLTQTLTVTAAQGDQLVVSALPNKPTGYLAVTETQANATVFSGDVRNQAVRNLVVRFGNTTTGSLTLDALARIGGNLTVNGGIAATSVNLAGTVGGNVTYAALPVMGLGASDWVTLEPSAQVGGSVLFRLGDGPNQVRLRGGTVRGNLTVTGTTGDDTVQLTESADLTVNGSAAFNLGDGTNTVTGTGTHVIHVGNAFTYGGGVGNDTFDLDGSGTALDVRGDARFTLGNARGFDANAANFESLTARNVTFVGGAGSDAVEVSGSLAVTGNMTVTPGTGENSFTSNLLGSGTNTIGGSFNYLGGMNGDAVSLDATTVGRNVTVALGESFGSGVAAFSTGLHGPGAVTVYGGLKVTTGPTSDSAVQLARLYVGNGLTVLGGAGRNQVSLDDVNVAGSTLVDLGAGDDGLGVEQVVGNSGGPLGGASTFGGTFTFRGGVGDDHLTLAADGTPGLQVQFGGRAVLTGGVGADTLVVGTGTTFEVTGNTGDFDTRTGVVVV
jgi:hypothetical protein